MKNIVERVWILLIKCFHGCVFQVMSSIAKMEDMCRQLKQRHMVRGTSFQQRMSTGHQGGWDYWRNAIIYYYVKVFSFSPIDSCNGDHTWFYGRNSWNWLNGWSGKHVSDDVPNPLTPRQVYFNSNLYTVHRLKHFVLFLFQTINRKLHTNILDHYVHIFRLHFVIRSEFNLKNLIRLVR